MSHTLILPPLDDPATEFVVEQYYVDVDVPVIVGQAVALVRSERWAWDVPATTGGVISKLLIEPGSTVAAGAALIELSDQQPTTNNDQQQVLEAERRDAVPTAAAQRMRATPVARRVAAAHGLDLAVLVGTGRGNVVTRADVLAVLANEEQHPEGTRKNKEQEPVNGQGAALDDQTEVDIQPSPSNLSTFQPRVPHRAPSGWGTRCLSTFQPFDVPYALTAIEVDLATALATVRQHAARWARRGVTVTATACVAAVTVAALREHALLHSAWHPDGIILRNRVQLAIQHCTTGEHQRTVIPHAADLNAVGIARRLAHGAHHEEIERQAATFVIMERTEPWWAHALPGGTCTTQLNVGAIVQQPRVVATAHGDQIMVRPIVVLTLRYDARVATQHEADALLCTIKRRLEHLHSL